MIFPGQGSQSVGMGKALAEANPAARAIFEQADAVLGRPLSQLCFEGPEDELKLTVNTQPALYVTSAAALAVQVIPSELVITRFVPEFATATNRPLP